MKDKKRLLDFSDLEFQPHAHVADGIMAKLDLGNDFEISVVSMKEKERTFGGLYGNASEGTYEVAVFYKNDMIPLCKFDDVVGWQDEAQVSKIMKEAQVNGVAWVQLLRDLREESEAELYAN